MKKYIFIFTVALIFSRATFASASVSISEIMYDLDGADVDWVEVQNQGRDI